MELPETRQLPIRRIVIMGVSGCGKSTVSRALAHNFDAAFIEGDDLHTTASVAKMSRGEALNDDDRMPWLRAVGRALSAPSGAAVVSCSALRRCYRDTIRGTCPEVVFVHLDVSRAMLEARLNARQGHFMSSALLDSQLDTLEPLEPDEDGIVIAAGDMHTVIADATAALLERETRSRP